MSMKNLMVIPYLKALTEMSDDVITAWLNRYDEPETNEAPIPHKMMAPEKALAALARMYFENESEPDKNVARALIALLKCIIEARIGVPARQMCIRKNGALHFVAKPIEMLS